MDSIGESLRQLRLEKGKTLKCLAQELGTSIATLQKIEVGERLPSLTLIRKLSKYYDFSIDSFLDDNMEDRGSIHSVSSSRYVQIDMSFSL